MYQQDPTSGGLFVLTGTYYGCAVIPGDLKWNITSYQHGPLIFYSVNLENSSLALLGTVNGTGAIEWNGTVSGAFNIADDVIAAASVEFSSVGGVSLLHAEATIVTTYIDLSIAIDYEKDPECGLTLPALDDELDAYDPHTFIGQVFSPLPPISYMGFGIVLLRVDKALLIR